MWEKLKGELTAAVAISGALLLAAGYLFVWGQLSNAGLPGQPILAALPTTVFVSAAVEALAVPLVLLITLVAAALALLTGRSGFPKGGWWLGFGILLALAARAVSLVHVPLLGGWNGSATLWSAITGAGVVILSGLAGAVVGRLVGGRRSLQTAAAVMVLLTVIAASAYRIVDAWKLERPLPYVGVFLDTGACPAVFDAQRTPLVSMVTAAGTATPSPQPKRVEEPRCYVGGYYVAENDHWLFVAETPNKQAGAPGRLLLVPRDAAQLAATANQPLNQLPAGGR